MRAQQTSMNSPFCTLLCRFGTWPSIMMDCVCVCVCVLTTTVKFWSLLYSSCVYRLFRRSFSILLKNIPNCSTIQWQFDLSRTFCSNGIHVTHNSSIISFSATRPLQHALVCISLLHKSQEQMNRTINLPGTIVCAGLNSKWNKSTTNMAGRIRLEWFGSYPQSIGPHWMFFALICSRIFQSSEESEQEARKNPSKHFAEDHTIHFWTSPAETGGKWDGSAMSLLDFSISVFFRRRAVVTALGLCNVCFNWIKSRDECTSNTQEITSKPKAPHINLGAHNPLEMNILPI